MLLQKQGKHVSKDKIEQRRLLIGEEKLEHGIQQLEQKYHASKNEQKDVINHGKQIRENELLDKYRINIESEDEKA